MTIREYSSDDCAELMRLFRETVLVVGLRDYAPEQTKAWAAGASDPERWDRAFLQSFTLIAEIGGEIVGFGNIDQAGYLDMLYVHKDHQREGIASAICDRLEQTAGGEITVHASITARGFFEKRGYAVVNEQQVVRRGVALTNFVMKKRHG